MAQPYIGEIRLFAGTFAPVGWAFCNGQEMPISENDALFQLIGTTYGGDGQETFALPNLCGRVPLHMGTSTASGVTYQIGEMAGVESVTLSTQQIPTHTHTMLAGSDPAASRNPAGGVFSRTGAEGYASEFTAQPLNAGSISAVGGSQPHENRQPVTCINHIISLYGLYPTPT